MKSTIIYCLFILIAIQSFEANADCQNNSGPGWSKPGEILSVKYCLRKICRDDGTWELIQCPKIKCKTQIGKREFDRNKPFPECCQAPICAPGKMHIERANNLNAVQLFSRGKTSDCI
ncbi:hypothetical protein HCN44_003311 [Aphidius gifuensis]|uniref:Single domain-containing protein n=1 Tax=Aphidius gifuensis TaxID=684658 RepID=A0A834XLH9_APHGI|nr:hypothetical protein HCN44_003311 [Aphidius gifuensis]